MSYATPDSLVNRYGQKALLQLLDEKRCNQLAPYTDQMASALSLASSVIDTYLSQRYELPLRFDAVPSCLQHWCEQIAIYELSNARAGGPERWRGAYDDAVKHLEGISKGHQQLQTPGHEQQPNERSVFKPAQTHAHDAIAAYYQKFRHGRD